MKLSCNREKLHHAFQLAASVAPTRSPKEILHSIKLEAKDDEVLLTATDLESSIRIQVEQVDVQVPGTCLLNVVRVGNILRELNDSQLELETTDSGITLRGEHSEFHLPSANPDEYPVVAEFSESSYCEVPARLFREMVRRTSFATDIENSRFALGGVLFEIAGDEITAVATDGRRLVRMIGSCKPVQGHKTTSPTTIIPTKTLTLMERSIGDKDEVVHLAARSNDVVLRTPRATIQSCLVEGRFPNWRQVIPNRTSSIIIESNVGPFFSSVRQAAVVADPESR
ncbi:MAG: DNA polymerase III subunit beta, partial [Pirellulaceae bacterium]